MSCSAWRLSRAPKQTPECPTPPSPSPAKSGSRSSIARTQPSANIEKDRAWIESHVGARARVEDESEATALLALQGPRSADVLRGLGVAADSMRRFRFEPADIAGGTTLLSRTGYTGADGFELYTDAAHAETLFEALLEAGGPLGLEPAGLGARDTLRLEAALPLYGHELDDAHSPFEAGLAAFVDLDGRDFVGAEALRRPGAEAPARRLVGFELVERGVAREGHPVTRDGERVGTVTSGAPSPTLGKSIGLAYVPAAHAEPGAALEISIRGRATQARVVPTPFVSGHTAGRTTT